MARRELGIWRRLDHKSIVPFLGVAYGFGPHVALVSLWMPHGTLQSFLASFDEKLAVAHRLQLLLDIANGLLYLHTQSIVHGDLTPNNVLIDESYCARLVDFGFASVIGETPEALRYLHASTRRHGAVRWAAPEHFQDGDVTCQRTPKNDIYSYGNIALQARYDILQVMSGKQPWSEIQEDVRVMICLSKGQKPARPLFARSMTNIGVSSKNVGYQSIERLTANDLISTLKCFVASNPPHVPLSDLLGSSSHTSNL
ncbi:kinase-like domain-containing protein [Melanogaster broomeanus]|nr:kinase-like domain-containing protein [Melanogaster broomeanus]